MRRGWGLNFLKQMNTPTHEELCQTLALVSKVLATQLEFTRQLGRICIPQSELPEHRKSDLLRDLDALSALVPPLQAAAAHMQGFRSN